MGTSVKHFPALIFVRLERVDDGVEVGLLLRVAQQSRGCNVGNVVPVELHECQLEDQTHELVKVCIWQHLRVHHFLLTALAQSVVAGVQEK